MKAGLKGKFYLPIILLLSFIWLFGDVYAQTCDFQKNDPIAFTFSGGNMGVGFETKFVLTNNYGQILDIQTNPLFPNGGTTDVVGVYALNFPSINQPVGLQIGSSICQVGGDCLDIYGPMYLGLCPFDCDFLNDDDIVFSATGGNNSGTYTSTYILADSVGLVLSANTAASFPAQPVGGIYSMHAINHPIASSFSSIAVDTPVSSINSTCIDKACPVAFLVCDPVFLPIEDIEFTAEFVNDNSVQIKWRTPSEVNTDYFTVEKTLDGQSFSGLANVYGAGNSQQVLHYSQMDEEPFKGLSYYRIKVTDIDGSFTYTNLKAVLNTNNDVDIVSIYPNPSFGSQLTLHASEEIAGLRLFDAAGRFVYYGNLNGTLSVQVKPGVYFLDYSYQNKKYFNKAVVVN